MTLPRQREIVKTIRGAKEDAAKDGKVITEISFDREGVLSFEYSDPPPPPPPPPSPPPKKVDYSHLVTKSRVYVIGEEHGPVKIGVSVLPTSRLAALQIGYPYELHILVEFHGGEEAEMTLHRFFAQERLRGEWFERSERVQAFIDMMLCGVGLSLALQRCGRL